MSERQIGLTRYVTLLAVGSVFCSAITIGAMEKIGGLINPEATLTTTSAFRVEFILTDSTHHILNSSQYPPTRGMALAITAKSGIQTIGILCYSPRAEFRNSLDTEIPWPVKPNGDTENSRIVLDNQNLQRFMAAIEQIQREHLSC